MIEIRQAGLKGLGIFAARPIAKGTRILSERPLLIVHSERQVFAALRQIDEDTKRKVASLSVHPVQKSSVASWGQALWHAISPIITSTATTSTEKALAPIWSSLTQYPTLLSVFRNNNFDIGDGRQAMFSDICRLNHSCVPNSQGNFNKQLGQFTIHAIQPIEKDAEITISYLNEHGALKESRQGRLKHSYGFLCDCPACDTSKPRGKEGEAKRIAFQEKLHAFAEAAEAQSGIPNQEGEFSLMKDCIDMYEGEGIAGRELCTMYLAAADLAVELGRTQEAMGFAERALALEADCVGTDSEHYHETEERCKSLLGSLNG